jgi:hypothetical protein
MRSLSGGSFSMIASTFARANDKKGLTARRSATKAPSKAQSLSDRLTPLLISAGLIAGTIPTSMRKACGQRCLDRAFFERDGDTSGIAGDECEQKAGS